MTGRNTLAAVDRYQRRNGWLGFPLAVVQKYADDQGGYLAAGITYYAFFSIFPLLLVFVSALGFVLHGHPGLEKSIVQSALGQFPVVGPQLQSHSLTGSGVGLGIGAISSLWAGTGVCLATQNALDQLWGLPYTQRPNFVGARVRSLLLLLVLGAGVLATTALGSLATSGAHLGVAWAAVTIAVSFGLDFLLFWIAFRTLTTSHQSWRCLRGGAVAAAVAYEGLQLLGGYYVAHVLKSAGNTYGTFALVIGLLSWIYLTVHVTLLAAEGNVVATRHLWPRGLTIGAQPPATEADTRALRQRAVVEKRRDDEQIEVSFAREETGGGSAAANT